MISASLRMVSPGFSSQKKVAASRLNQTSTPLATPIPLFGKQNALQSTNQWLKAFSGNIAELFFPTEQTKTAVHHHDISKAATNTVENIVKQSADYTKISGACFDRPLKDGASQHTHHYVHSGPKIHGNGEDQKTTFWVGETLTNVPGIELDAGQKAVQVNFNLVKNYLKNASDPLKLDKLPDKAFQKIKAICFDFPNGEHTHHGLYQGPTVTVRGKDGQSKAQQTAILVGQWLCAKILREKGLKIDKDVQMGVLITDNLFQQGKTVQHA
jgi:hypothetical protein